MKTVVSRSQVAHLFAHQAQDHARTASGNFYFYGNRCTSYGPHYLAAVHLGDVVLLNSNRYSNTTARQLGELWRACNHLVVFQVPDPAAETVADHRENFAYLIAEYRRELIRLSRARVHTSQDYARNLRNIAADYAARFNVRVAVPPFETVTAGLRVVSEISEKNRAARQAIKERAARQARKEAQERAERWRAGAYHYPLHALPCMLRLSGDGETVQTSHGAEFPARHARRALPFVLECFATGVTWCRGGGNGPRLGAFRLDAIHGLTGTLKAGCHTVTRAEVERLARLLGT